MNKIRKNELPENFYTAQFKRLIVSVEGHTDKAVIDNFAENMPAIDSRHLRLVNRVITPNIEIKETICFTVIPFLVYTLSMRNDDFLCFETPECALNHGRSKGRLHVRGFVPWRFRPNFHTMRDCNFSGTRCQQRVMLS